MVVRVSRLAWLNAPCTNRKSANRTLEFEAGSEIKKRSGAVRTEVHKSVLCSLLSDSGQNFTENVIDCFVHLHFECIHLPQLLRLCLDLSDHLSPVLERHFLLDEVFLGFLIDFERLRRCV